MAALLQIGVTDGVPDDGTGTVATINALMAMVATAAKQDSIITILSTQADSLAAATPAGTNIIGQIGIDQTTQGATNRVTAGDTSVIDVTLSTDTSAYASGDLIADTQVITNAMRVADFGGVLSSLMVIDKDDQGAAFDIYFLDANVTFGTENSAPSISDANAASILAMVSVSTSDYKDLGGVKVAQITSLARTLKPASGTRDVYVAVVNGSGTPTYTASGLVLRLGLVRD